MYVKYNAPRGAILACAERQTSRRFRFSSGLLSSMLRRDTTELNGDKGRR